MSLQQIVTANRVGEQRGIPSWCTAHPETLRAILSSYAGDDEPVLIEATCNQVNQFGGYTGMTPAGFRNFVEILAAGEGVDPARLILGGDHLGPNPWRREPAAIAMQKAKEMVAAYVEAGFDKIHLDASMPCADDDGLTDETRTARAAELCAVAEAAGGRRPLSYVIGTEVPVPGGETNGLNGIAITRPEAARQTFHLHELALARHGLDAAIDRIVALVVQPGVDFGNAEVLAYEPAEAAELSATIEDLPGIVFEAHSTDYQAELSLAGLVADHFAILKVGPELTFAFRQAVIAMAQLEAWLDVAPSDILDVVTAEMRRDPSEWRNYIPENNRTAAMRLFGLSDRVRYYWPRPAVATALQQLFANIDAARPEPGLIAQYVPFLLEAPASGASMSQRIITHHVSQVVAKYRRATGTA